MLKRWTNKQRVPAIHKRDLEAILMQLGILERLKEGALRCAECGNPVTLDNIQCLYMENNEIKLCCSNMNCYKTIITKKDNKKDADERSN